MKEINPVNTPDMKEINPVNTPDMKEINPVNTPDMKEINPVNTPDMKEINPVNTPDMKEINPVNTPDMKEIFFFEESTVDENTIGACDIAIGLVPSDARFPSEKSIQNNAIESRSFVCSNIGKGREMVSTALSEEDPVKGLDRETVPTTLSEEDPVKDILKPILVRKQKILGPILGQS